jgi:hypothetical protein
MAIVYEYHTSVEFRNEVVHMAVADTDTEPSSYTLHVQAEGILFYYGQITAITAITLD